MSGRRTGPKARGAVALVTYRSGMLSVRTRAGRRLLRAGLVALPAGSTTLVAHALVTGALPAPGAVLAGVAAAGSLAAALPRVRPMVAVLVAQLALHAVFAVTQPAGCLQQLRRAAWAGVDLAVGAAAGCEPAVFLTAGTPQQVALLTLLSVVPLIAAHALGAVLAASGTSRVEDAVRSVLLLAAGVLVALPRLVRVPARRRLPSPVGSPRVPASSLVPVRPLTRRGPPALLPA